MHIGFIGLERFIYSVLSVPLTDRTMLVLGKVSLASLVVLMILGLSGHSLAKRQKRDAEPPDERLEAILRALVKYRSRAGSRGGTSRPPGTTSMPVPTRVPYPTLPNPVSLHNSKFAKIKYIFGESKNIYVFSRRLALNFDMKN